MGGRSNVRKPDKRQLKILQNFIDTHDDAAKLRRAEILMLFAKGMSGRDIAETIGVHENTVYGCLRAFSELGVSSVFEMNRGGATPCISDRQKAEIIRIANLPPSEFDLPYGRWSLPNLRNHLIRTKVVDAISKEHLRRILKKGGSSTARSNASSQDWTQGARRF